MIVLGLTGSIGMGKSTTAAMFAEAGVPVHDSDAVVHALYEGRAAEAIACQFPDAVVGGKIDRAALGSRVFGNPAALRRLEAILHPLVAAARDEFLNQERLNDASVVVLDIPLLFEIGGADDVDAVVVASAAPDVQRARVMARPGMTLEKFERILARQVPDEEKRSRADFIVDTDKGLDSARQQVRAILQAVASRGCGPKRGTT